MSFKLRSLTLAVATFSAMTAHSAGLDRSGQDITAFLQDGDYADIIYTHIDADVKGKDTANREVKDIAPSYDFFRYNVKTDVNDRVSVGVLYDEPFGAKVQYDGLNNFTGVADVITWGVVDTLLAQDNIDKTQENGDNLVSGGKLIAANGETALGDLYQQVGNSIKDSGNNLQRMKTLKDSVVTLEQFVAGAKATIPTMVSTSETKIAELRNQVEALPDGKHKTILQGALDQYAQSLTVLKQAPTALDKIAQDNGGTNVEIHTRNLTGLVGVKLGEKKNIQVYAGPAFQKLEGEVHLRGNTYKTATGYDAQITPDTAVGWVAGVSYNKPEIALKASLTYRSEIEHSTPIQEALPLAPLGGLPAEARGDFKVTLPESYNLDFQTGLSAKHRLLGTVKVRYVPWGDFAITPPLYNQASNLNIVDYAKDQWSAEVGLGKQVNDKLAVSGSVGWDSGAGNPATSLGPVKGYYSLGLGAKYNITQNWALSAGAKYLKFGDATAQLPDKTNVGEFKNNDGYIVGLKLSYQNK